MGLAEDQCREADQVAALSSADDRPWSALLPLYYALHVELMVRGRDGGG